LVKSRIVIPDQFGLWVLGTLKKSAGTGTNPIQIQVNNQGILNAQSGTMELDMVTGVDGAGILLAQPSATFIIHGNVLGQTTNADEFAPAGTLDLAGPGSASAPELLEVMGQDLGNVAAGFTHNFVYGNLTLNGGYVQLVDYAHNSAGTGPEALYVNSLIVASGTTLDLNAYHVYARAAQIDGTVINGSISLLGDGGAIQLGSSVPGSLTSATQVDDWTFYGRAGQAVTVTVNTGAGSSIVPLQPT
jgi:hypothetical protein